MRLWILLILVQQLYSSRLSRSEYESVKRICGPRLLISSSKKSFGGRLVKKGEFPWLASIYGSAFTCSGALISSRHVLTASHCIIKTSEDSYTEEECKKMGHKNTRRLFGNASQFIIVPGNRCPRADICMRFAVRPTKMFYHEKYDECSSKNDIAIFEIPDVPPQIALPICTAGRKTKVSKKLQSAGHGAIAPDTAKTLGYQVVNITLHERTATTLITKADLGVGICSGDSGGPLFQTDSKGRYTVVGVMSNGNTCDMHFKKKKLPNSGTSPASDIFTDVSKYSKWICSKSGVCPK